jgi:hypothetical protein
MWECSGLLSRAHLTVLLALQGGKQAALLRDYRPASFAIRSTVRRLFPHEAHLLCVFTRLLLAYPVICAVALAVAVGAACVVTPGITSPGAHSAPSSRRDVSVNAGTVMMGLSDRTIGIGKLDVPVMSA